VKHSTSVNDFVNQKVLLTTGEEGGVMRFALMIEAQQGLSYEDQLAIARRAEAAGFETLFRSDHYASFPGDADQPTTDAWAVLAGLARETSKIHLGTLVSPVTFRHPGNFVKLVTTVDQMSGGRIEVGVGAGWNEADHLPHGLPFPDIKERADLLEDQLAILHGLWEEKPGWKYDGKQVKVRRGKLVAGPVQVDGRPVGTNGRSRPRIITGSGGSPRGYRIAAKWSDEFNLSSSSPDMARKAEAELDEACRAIGRDPRTLTRSVMAGVLMGRDAAEVERRAGALLGALGQQAESGMEWLNARRSRWILGTPDEARAMVKRFADVGVERLMLQDFVPLDLEMIDLMAAELIGKV
jgi:alkanesulfonate monooxygenase SsuD/methylene tetrahydromethanopterin reductase-like flavin-dependent oxidoreductase (luciferase family)